MLIGFVVLVGGRRVSFENNAYILSVYRLVDLVRSLLCELGNKNKLLQSDDRSW